MNTVRQLGNFWRLWVTTIVLACSGNVFAQTSYRVTDLGGGKGENEACAMSVNDEGWTEIMAWNGDPAQDVNFIVATLLSGRALIDVDGFKLDLGTLGGKNSWMNWGEINNFGQTVGLSETAVPDPNGEDICGFGTHLTCRPFLWQFSHMSALPTLGGNNGEASAINNRGQIVGMAEDGTVDSSCPPDTTNNRIQLPVLWENGKAHALPTAGHDPDGFALWINDHGQAVGTSGTCGGATSHAVLWQNDTVSPPLPDIGGGAIAYGINNRGQIVGSVYLSPGGATRYAALWQNGALKNLGTLPGDLSAIATGINEHGQVVGSTWDSHFNWSHAFIYQDGKMTDLNTLFPESSNLFATMANKINERGQISGMAKVLSGPDEGKLHAFLATPVNERIGRSVADVARTPPGPNLPANVGKQLLQRFGLGRLAQ
jgi:probable HAF family extracellular repeat protein